jgi:hypothetical protein
MIFLFVANTARFLYTRYAPLYSVSPVPRLRLKPFRMRAAVMCTAIMCAISVVATGCIFTTRAPETPDTRRSTYLPPTSSQVVVSNLQAAVREKNIENYIQCLASSDTGSVSRRYAFEPSAEAAARFASVFIGWTTNRERQAFTAFIAKIPTTSSPALDFTGDRFDAISPDSAVYVANYRLRPNYQVNGAPEEFTGTMRLTISSFSNGFWAITRWSDQTASQTTTASWSVLKAQFAN